ncbi:MAG: prepilin peptidase [Spirulina sp. DLM2.Bin59]|nr:MAG: prepilin peptidase [Spirulina sp. DLM2.Bin59]
MDHLLTLTTTLFILIIGAAIGSFLNVIIYRIPAGKSILFPPSHCPHCQTHIHWYDNIPVLAWFWLRGKCRHCGGGISWRYPFIEAIAALLFLATFWQFGPTLTTVGYCLLLSWLLALALIDCDTLTLPNPLTQSGLVAGLVFLLLQGWIETTAIEASLSRLITGIFGAVLALWGLELIAFIGSIFYRRTAMGAGDAKLLAMIGAWLGWQGAALAAFLGCVGGAFLGGGAIALGLLNRKQPIPFGPFLALGAVITVFWGEIIITSYQRLIFGAG